MFVCLVLQELEMQARVHGLPATSPSGLNAAELAHQVVKQEVSGEEGTTTEIQQQPPLHPDPETRHQPSYAPPQSPYHQLDFTHSLSFDENSRGFHDTLDPSQNVSFPSLSKKELDLMLMEDTMLPVASDPLFSAVSPEASKASSRRSSFSMEDTDMLWLKLSKGEKTRSQILLWRLISISLPYPCRPHQGFAGWNRNAPEQAFVPGGGWVSVQGSVPAVGMVTHPSFPAAPGSQKLSGPASFAMATGQSWQSYFILCDSCRCISGAFMPCVLQNLLECFGNSIILVLMMVRQKFVLFEKQL